MQIGVNVAALPWDGDFAELPKVLDSVGCDVVEFPVQLWQARSHGEPLAHGIRVASVSGLLRRTDVLPESLLAPRAVWEREAVLLPERVAVAKAVGSPALSMSIPPWANCPEAEARALFLQRLRRCADAAARADLVVNIEFVAPSVARAGGDRHPILFCPSLDAARDLIAGANRPNVNLLLDLLHWAADGDAADPGSLAHEVGLVHLCDHVDARPEALTDDGRLPPFEGALPVREFVSALVGNGYAGPAVIEVFQNGHGRPAVDRTAASVRRLRAHLSEHAVAGG